jgi:hypothetical protein
MRRALNKRIPACLALLTLLMPAVKAGAREILPVIITSNLEGRASLGMDEVENDFLLMLGQSILHEKRRGRAELYLDLGNAFYPGPLSRFSFGSVMMDFFEFFDCSATLISTKDLRIGVDNLDFIRNNRKTRLLSANILRKDQPVFLPYFIHEKGAQKICFVGLSSPKILVDIAERNVFSIGLADPLAALERTLAEAKKTGAEHFVVLSGMSNRENIGVLKRFPDIGLVIAGGDNRGIISGAGVNRIDFDGGRSIIQLPDKNSYYTIQLEIDKGIAVAGFQKNEIARHKTLAAPYREFADRFALWKKEYAQEGMRVIASAGKGEYVIDNARTANLLRDRYNAEIAILAGDTMKGEKLSGEIRQYDIHDLSNDEYPLFVYYLKGSQLQGLAGSPGDLHLSGYSKGLVQGHPVNPAREYRVVSTQTVYEQVRRKSGAPLSMKNMWIGIPDLISKDVGGEKVLFRDDYGYLERRFRATLDLQLSNFFDLLSLISDGSFSSPGGPTASYQQWGLENNIVLNIYNRYHRFILNPYMNYIEMQKEVIDSNTREKRTETLIVKNLLRGIFEYRLNYFTYVNPYHKSQVDTVVKRDDYGDRPAFIREVVGAGFLYKTLEGKLGAGFERKVNDPREEPVYGFETFLSWRLEFWRIFTYSVKLDSFIAKTDAEEGQGGYFRSEVINSLGIKLTDNVGLSLKHRWYYYRSDMEEQTYNYQQYLTSLDLKTDFKIF